MLRSLCFRNDWYYLVHYFYSLLQTSRPFYFDHTLGCMACWKKVFGRWVLRVKDHAKRVGLTLGGSYLDPQLRRNLGYNSDSPYSSSRSGRLGDTSSPRPPHASRSAIAGPLNNITHYVSPHIIPSILLCIACNTSLIPLIFAPLDGWIYSQSLWTVRNAFRKVGGCYDDNTLW